MPGASLQAGDERAAGHIPGFDKLGLPPVSSQRQGAAIRRVRHPANRVRTPAQLSLGIARALLPEAPPFPATQVGLAWLRQVGLQQALGAAKVVRRQLLEEGLPQGRVGLHHLPLGRVELVRLAQDPVGDPHLADVVEDRRGPDQGEERLADRGGALELSTDRQTWFVLFDEGPQYALKPFPLEGKFGCAIKQTINGQRLDGAQRYATADDALRGGLEDLRKTLGW